MPRQFFKQGLALASPVFGLRDEEGTAIAQNADIVRAHTFAPCPVESDRKRVSR